MFTSAEIVAAFGAAPAWRRIDRRFFIARGTLAIHRIECRVQRIGAGRRGVYAVRMSVFNDNVVSTAVHGVTRQEALRFGANQLAEMLAKH